MNLYYITVLFLQTEQMVAAGEKLVGPYVWGRYDLLVLPPTFPYGGMENPCLTFVTPTLLVCSLQFSLYFYLSFFRPKIGSLIKFSWVHSPLSLYLLLSYYSKFLLYSWTVLQQQN